MAGHAFVIHEALTAVIITALDGFNPSRSSFAVRGPIERETPKIRDRPGFFIVDWLRRATEPVKCAGIWGWGVRARACGHKHEFPFWIFCIIIR